MVDNNTLIVVEEYLYFNLFEFENFMPIDHDMSRLHFLLDEGSCVFFPQSRLDIDLYE